MIKLPPLVAVLGFYLLIYTEGCGRTPATPAPPVVTTPSYVNTTIPENHRLVCNENETQKTACLHGGSCQATILDDYRTISCACPKKYIGDRCQMIDPTIIFGMENEERVTKAGLAVGITALVLFLTVLIFIIIWHRRYRKRRSREKEEKVKEQERALLQKPDLSNGNYKPSVNSRNRDSYRETIPLTLLPLTQIEPEIQKEEEKLLNKDKQKSNFSEREVKRLSLLSYIPYADEDGAATNV